MMGKCLPSARPASSRAHRRRRRNKAGLVPRTQHHTPHLLHILQHIFRSAITFLDDAGSQIFTQAHHEYGGHGQRLILRGWADRGGLLMRGEFHVFKHTSFPHITPTPRIVAQRKKHAAQRLAVIRRIISQGVDTSNGRELSLPVRSQFVPRFFPSSFPARSQFGIGTIGVLVWGVSQRPHLLAEV